LIPGNNYEITSLGTTDWNEVAGTTGETYDVGDIIPVVAPGSGSGTAVIVNNDVPKLAGVITPTPSGIFVSPQIANNPNLNQNGIPNNNFDPNQNDVPNSNFDPNQFGIPGFQAKPSTVPGDITPILENNPIPSVAPLVAVGPTIITGPLNYPIIIQPAADFDPNNLPPNLDPRYTSSTLLPAVPSIQEAIDRVIECNCDCWIS
jgi:hypothetical protein